MVDCFIKVLSILFNGFSKIEENVSEYLRLSWKWSSFNIFFLSCVFTKKGETIGTRLMNYCIEDC